MLRFKSLHAHLAPRIHGGHTSVDSFGVTLGVKFLEFSEEDNKLKALLRGERCGTLF